MDSDHLLVKLVDGPSYSYYGQLEDGPAMARWVADPKQTELLWIVGRRTREFSEMAVDEYDTLYQFDGYGTFEIEFKHRYLRIVHAKDVNGKLYLCFDTSSLYPDVVTRALPQGSSVKYGNNTVKADIYRVTSLDQYQERMRSAASVCARLSRACKGHRNGFKLMMDPLTGKVLAWTGQLGKTLVATAEHRCVLPDDEDALYAWAAGKLEIALDIESLDGGAVVKAEG